MEDVAIEREKEMCKVRCGSDWRQTKAATVDGGKQQRRGSGGR